jgi:hypothetical protein
MAQEQAAPAHLQRNLAAVGALLNDAAYRATRAVEPGSADSFVRAGDAWRRVADLTGSLRTLQPTRAGDVDRIRIRELLAQIDDPRRQVNLTERSRALGGLAIAYDEVAAWNSAALSAAHSQGQVLLTGRALPGRSTSESRALTEAKLADRPVLAPTHTIRALTRSYQEVSAARSITLTPALLPPSHSKE